MVKRIKLTPKNRLKVYEKALEDLDFPFLGLCLKLKKATEFYQEGIDDKRSYRKMKKCFPEVYALKPKNPHSEVFWFSLNTKGETKRRTILKKAIKDVKSKYNL